MTIMKVTEDGRTIALESLWQPLYDTQKLVTGQASIAYFQFPAGRGRQYTNHTSALWKHDDEAKVQLIGELFREVV